MLIARNPVILFANGIGDGVMNLPALRALALHFGGRATLVTHEGEEAFFFDELPLRGRVGVTFTSEPRGSRHIPVDQLRCKLSDCDMLISLVPWWSPSLGELLSEIRPAYSVGFFPAFRTYVPLNYEKHSADLAFDIVKSLWPEARIDDFVAPPQFPSKAQAFVAALRGLFPAGSKFLAVHAETCAPKMWPWDRFARVIDRFLDDREDFAAIVVSDRSPYLRDMRNYAQGRVLPCFGLPLSCACAVVASADLFLGIDSCMLHVADFARTPGVGIFGPTNSAEFGFRVGPNITLQARATEDTSESEVLDAMNAMIKTPAIRVVRAKDSDGVNGLQEASKTGTRGTDLRGWHRGGSAEEGGKMSSEGIATA